jgi:hypothetical protein
MLCRQGLMYDQKFHPGARRLSRIWFADDEGQGNFGFDAARKEYVDQVEAGIVDPARVVRTALVNAVSVARVRARPSLVDIRAIRTPSQEPSARVPRTPSLPASPPVTYLGRGP